MRTHLLLLAIIIASLYGGYNFFIKLSSYHINHVLGAAILQGSSLLLGFPILIYLQVQGRFIKVTKYGIIFSLIAGLLVGLAEILSFYFLEKVDASQGIPIIVGGTVLAGAILGIIVLHESLNPFKLAGILMIFSGILMVLITPERLQNIGFSQFKILGDSQISENSVHD